MIGLVAATTQSNHPADALFALLPCGFAACFGAFALLAVAFWIWTLIDCATNMPSEGNDKVVWILVIVLAGWIGALIYFFVVRSKRVSQGRGF